MCENINIEGLGQIIVGVFKVVFNTEALHSSTICVQCPLGGARMSGVLPQTCAAAGGAAAAVVPSC